MKTSKNSLTILLGMTIIASVAVLSTTTVTYAWHDFLTPSWSGPTHTFKCLSSLNSLGDSYVDECGDLTPAADKWNNVANSAWDITESATGEVEVSGADLGTGSTLALATITVSWGTITDVKIEFNNKKGWTDALFTNSSTDYDWQSIAVHEFGHVLKLNHNTDSNSPLYATFSTDEVRRTLTSHDKSVTAGKY